MNAGGYVDLVISDDTVTEFARLVLVPAGELGDMNCDGVISVSDIGGFVLALTNPIEYAAQYPACESQRADLNNDGIVSVSDIGPFVELLVGSQGNRIRIRGAPRLGPQQLRDNSSNSTNRSSK